ncbi:family 20 glycosylhydrolase [Sphingobacterium anhuiense]|uniref:beta-N-acetylhexosaminidase n=1 Tax=Sphingobacterium anhuiense TaxID=493780 RepID=A0ABW5YRT7_9SPHI
MNLKLKYLSILLVSISFFSISSAQENLIPLPINMELGEAMLDLKKGIVVNENNTALTNEYQLANTILADWKIGTKKAGHNNSLPLLTLELLGGLSENKEAYHLKIDEKGIHIKAQNSAGIYYGLQTLRQFSIQQKKLSFCEINDKPAFSWRSFLVDVGRNYQPLAMLKEQVDIMARYKLNVLHFHFTEDIAWRLASKKYPDLTDPSYITRGKGEHYTEQEFKELINYCKLRHILLLPEIDMPGHSDAFKRYFGVGMQTDSGMVYIKELLKEFSETYTDLPYLHIGGDEVKISNKNFIPEITKYVEELGYKTIGWDPGSNLMPQTIRQLWMGGPKKILDQGDHVFIDSKHLYINHMDPLETVTTLFHRKIGEQDKEHKNLIGATLCSWPDRAVAEPQDMFVQSAVYPALITFAERSWRGGGLAGWTCNIVQESLTGYQEFKAFETRLLHHKNSYFSDKPFPYVKQIGLKWELIGPFQNEGNLAKTFPIETKPFAPDITVKKTIEGGTVILRHWWADIVPGTLNDPQENTTWYARTKIWSEKSEHKLFWIGFNNLSRSYASNTPQLHTWDDLGSQVWVNNKTVEPPIWKHAGAKGDLETPLVDEGYTYRAPTKISLKKGWNEVLIKLPVSDFKGADWQNPVKWMFTFIQSN